MCTLMMVRLASSFRLRDEEICYSLNPNPAADFYIALYNAIQSGGAVGHGREGFYCAEGDEGPLYDACKAIAQALVDMHKIKNPEPTTFTKEEIQSYLRVSAFLLCDIDTLN